MVTEQMSMLWVDGMVYTQAAALNDNSEVVCVLLDEGASSKPEEGLFATALRATV